MSGKKETLNFFGKKFGQKEVGKRGENMDRLF